MRYLILVSICAILLAGCTTFQTIRFPPSTELFVTPGDDPGSESVKPYTPKGMLFVSSQEYYLPIPILGLIPLGNSDPEYVFSQKALPKIQAMGGDALIDTKIMAQPGPPFMFKLLGLGFYFPKVTMVSGTVVLK